MATTRKLKTQNRHTARTRPATLPITQQQLADLDACLNLLTMLNHQLLAQLREVPNA